MALSYATQHAMSPERSGRWETECLNTRFLMPALLCAGYSVKQKKEERNNFKLIEYSTTQTKIRLELYYKERLYKTKWYQTIY